MIMDDVAEELHIMQLSDSFFPTGLFTTSNGIEALFFGKKISTPAELLEFNKVMMEQQIGPIECIILANAYDSATKLDFGQIREVDAICCSIRTNKETREASIRSGNQLVRCVKEFIDSDETLNWYSSSLHDGKVTGSYPVSFSICCKAMKISKEKTLMMFLYGFVVSNVGAALRLGMIHHFEGQKIIHQLKPLITKIASENLNSPMSEIWQFIPQIEIFQMHHEKMDSKMFIT